jgi:flagellar protein FliS
MNPQAAASYLRTKVLTATPEQLQLMLYDGAIRFGEQARVALQQKNWEQSYTLLSRAQRIVTELTGSLRRAVAPDLCEKLAGIYAYVFRKLVSANTSHRIEDLDEAINLLRFQRETWVMLMDELGKKKAAAAVRSIDVPGPNSAMEATLSMQG